MPTNKKKNCLDDLRMRILRMEIAPGQDLDEVTLCERYGMSRTPMREILQRLAGEGYVVQAENRGAAVASMDLAVMRMFFQTAPLIYANVARQAAEKASDVDVESLRSIQARFRTATEVGDAGFAALQNHRFHLRIGEIADNLYLMPSLKRMLIDHTRLSQTFYRPSCAEDAARVAEAADQHDAMIEAFAAHDAERAVDLTIDHWNLSRDRLERFVSPDPLPIDPVAQKGRADAV